MNMKIFSPSFIESNPIPRKFSCEGADISPNLKWDEVPDNTKSFALILHDPDAPAGDWVHWVIYNIPGEKRELPEGVPGETNLLDGSRQGRNSWHQTRYGGPCPPSGTHRYFFRLYALDDLINLDAGADRKELMQAMQGHILAEAGLMGTYTKK